MCLICLVNLIWNTWFSICYLITIVDWLGWNRSIQLVVYSYLSTIIFLRLLHIACVNGALCWISNLFFQISLLVESNCNESEFEKNHWCHYEHCLWKIFCMYINKLGWDSKYDWYTQDVNIPMLYAVRSYIYLMWTGRVRNETNLDVICVFFFF